MWIVKIRELINNCKKLLKFVKLPSYKNVFLKVNRTGFTSFGWGWKAELIQRVKVSLAKYVGMFHHDCGYNVRFIFRNTKPYIFTIPENQSIPNTLWRCLNFSFSVKGLSNSNCLQQLVKSQQTAGKNLHCICRLILIWDLKS